MPEVHDYDDAGQLVGTSSFTDPPEATNLQALQERAAQALTANRTFLGLASPTAAQTTAQVRALTRQNQALIRLVLGLLDGTE